MKGHAIVITSGKGGVGKTTATANIGSAMARMGKKMVLIDADIGLRNLDVLLGLENRIVYDLVNVIEGSCRLEQALIRDKREKNLHLLPAAQTRDKDAVTPDQMSSLLDVLKSRFDYILVDCPAGIEQGFKNAVSGADEAVVITTPEVSAIRDADRIIGLLEANGLKEPQVIINRLKSDLVRKGDMMDVADMLEILAVKLLGVVPEDERIVISTNRGEPVVFDPRSPAGRSFTDIGRRLQGEIVPDYEWEKDRGILGRLKKFMGI